MKIFYVYKIENITTRKSYIGARGTNLEPDEDIGVQYFSSSKNKEFMSDQIVNSDNYVYDVLSIFNSWEEAIDYEIYLHNTYDVARNSMYYNLSKQTAVGFSSGMVGKTHTDETKILMSESAKNRPQRPPMSEEQKKKLSIAGKGKVRPPQEQVTCPHCGITGGKSSLKYYHFDNCGINFSASKGTKMSEEMKDLRRGPREKYGPQKTIECPYCDKVGGSSNMKRYHFENCRKRNYIKVSGLIKL